MTAFGYTILGFGSGVVGGTPTAIPAGSGVVFSDDHVIDGQCALLMDADDPNKCVMVYRDNSNLRCTAVVCTIDGTTITAGTPVIATALAKSTYYVGGAGVQNNKFVVSYQRSDSHYLFARIGDVDGTGITFGTEYAVNSAYMYWSECGWDFRGEDKFAIVWRVAGASEAGAAENDHMVRVGTVSGTTITMGTAVVMDDSHYSHSQTVKWDPNTDNTFAITFYKASHGAAFGRVCTVSGTTVTVGSVESLGGNYALNYADAMDYDPFTANKFVVVYTDAGAAKCKIGTVSGTSLTWGSEISFNGTDVANAVIAFDPNTQNQLAVVYESTDGDDYLACKIGTLDLSGDTIAFGDEFKIMDADPLNSQNRVTFAPSAWEQSGKFLVTYPDDDNSDYGTVVVCQIGTS